MPTTTKSALEIILEWSLSRPEWQRDALRRIVAGGALGETDIQELVALCKKEHGDSTVQLSTKPLTRGDLPASPGTGAAITLASIAGVEGVNQLAPNQELPFEPKGLTMIYGDNGAGKSGYARVLKRACRARFPGEIMPDAYDARNRKPATAAIGYERGGSAEPAIQWADDGKPHPVLSAVNVFDRESGAVHVRDKNEVAFRPFGLDIPDELAAACQAVKTALSAEQADLERARDEVFSKPVWKSGTEVEKILSALSATTKLDRLEELSKVSDAERERYRRLAEDLAKDPVRASSEQTLYADELRALAALLNEVGTLGGDAAIRALWDLSAAAASKRAAATIVADTAFAASALPGVGGNAWRSLWESARRYAAEVAYPAGHFPPCDPAEACVLCQQPLSDDTRARMASFEAYVRSDVQQQAHDAEAALAAALKDFDSKRIRIQSEARRRIALTDRDLARDVLRYLATARYRRALCRRAMAEAGKPVLPPMPVSPVDQVRELETRTRDYAAELLSAADIEGRTKLEAERDALADRLTLETLLDKAKDEVKRLRALRLLAACARDTSTTAITHLGNAIADEVVTPRIRDRFQEEIVRLAAARVRVEIVRAGGKYGSPVYQVKLFANKDAPVHMVLSEGEQTCVALAAFMTELATAAHQSALVFDDPVSSLDHLWRGKVAERLVEEAKVRQVIVFTHDLVFVNDLKDGADGNVPVKLVSLSRGPSGAGIVTPDLPWVAASVPDRVDKMEKDVRAAGVLYDDNDDTGYRDAVHRIYSNLRRTWERALEDVAFGGVIQRHRDYINAKNLRRATVFEDRDYQTFSAGFQKSSDWIDGHDGSRGRNAAPPTPDDMLADIKAVLDWVDDLKQRQKGLT